MVLRPVLLAVATTFTTALAACGPYPGLTSKGHAPDAQDTDPPTARGAHDEDGDDPAASRASRRGAFAGIFGLPFGSGPAYELDALDRAAPAPKTKPTCSTTSLVAYRGTTVKFEAWATVHPAFRARLQRFEEVARDVGIEVFGRAPKLLHHAGAYACRTTERGRMSEHAFGNALDVEGFSFPPLAKADGARLDERGIKLSPRQRGAMRLAVSEAWRPASSPETKRFFALLLERLRARDDVFRAVIGPPAKGHSTHLHLDAGPWRFDRYELPTATTTTPANAPPDANDG